MHHIPSTRQERSQKCSRSTCDVGHRSPVTIHTAHAALLNSDGLDTADPMQTHADPPSRWIHGVSFGAWEREAPLQPLAQLSLEQSKAAQMTNKIHMIRWFQLISRFQLINVDFSWSMLISDLSWEVHLHITFFVVSRHLSPEAGCNLLCQVTNSFWRCQHQGCKRRVCPWNLLRNELNRTGQLTVAQPFCSFYTGEQQNSCILIVIDKCGL